MLSSTGKIMAAALAIAWVGTVQADSTEAACEIYAKGSDKLEKMLACRFSQRQGYITISRDDGVVHDLTPVGDDPGNFVDQHGQAVYRQSGLGTAGQIFRLPNESVFVYWSTAALHPSDENNATAPFSTRDYDATTRLRCKAAADAEYGSCPAGILRMENRQASIVVQSQSGEQFTINFMTDYVNATAGEVEANLDGDIWTVRRDNGEVYEVPLAAIEGG